MPTLPPEFSSFIIEFAPLFSKRVFVHVQLMLIGALLAPGKRTVSAVLRSMGCHQDRTFHKYHRVLSRARWSAHQASKVLLRLLLKQFVPSGPLVFGIDETIERRWGKNIKARGIYRDAVRSSKSHFVKTSGLRWISLMLLCDIPWASRIWALPFLTVLAPSERYHQKQGKRHKTITDWARQMIIQLRRWLPERTIVVVADSTYAVLALLDALRDHVCFVTRLRLDAGLYDWPEAQPKSKRGPKPKKGKRLPKLESVLKDSNTTWQRLRVSQWYGRSQRLVEVATGTALWYSQGKPLVPIRWVLVRDVEGKLDTKAFLSTDLEASPLEILSWFVMRWQVEVTFEAVRAHLGVETQRQWSDLAIARTTPLLLGLFSLTTLLADQLQQQQELYIGTASWYQKQLPSFSDAIAAVRRKMWHPRYYRVSGTEPETFTIPRPLFDALIETLAYAA